MGFFDRFKKDDDVLGGPSDRPANIRVRTANGAVLSPVTGRLVAIEEVPDEAFASGALGQGVGIWPSGNVVYAPISGTVIAAMPHALGFTSDSGAEVLIHVGVDTVEMNGDGFRVYVEKGQHVHAGQALMTFDQAQIAAAGYQDVVIVVVTNADGIARVDHREPGEVAAGEQILSVRCLSA